MKSPKNVRHTRINKGFIASLSRSLALATLGAMGLTSTEAATNWLPISNASTDGINWLNGDNWDSFAVPAVTEDLTFALGEAFGPINLNGNQTANSLAFNDNYTVGALGTTDTLTTTTGNVSVNVGNFVTMNQRVGGQSGLILNGGGSLYLTNSLSPFNGGITVDNGSTLVHRQEGLTNQYNGAGSAQEFGRSDQVTLGFNTATRNITLQNGGVYKIINAGNNSEGNYKNIIIGTGGGTLNLAAGYLLQSLDDVGQITATTNTFTKAGKGRLVITGNLGAANPLGGIVNIDAGMLELGNQASEAVGANTYVRFRGIAGLGTTLNVNAGGTIFLNNGTAATLDTPVINLNGGILAVNSQDHAFGFATATAGSTTQLNISGTSTLLTRDLFGPQTQRFPRLRAELNGAGTLQILGNTNAGGTPRVVIERNTPTSNFSGTFKLLENTSLEANPRANTSVAGGTGTTVDTGKLLAGGDVEFAGWGSTLDIRDSSATTSVMDYTANNVSITTTQNGALNLIAPIRATTAAGTGHMFNFGTLTLGNHLLGIGGNNSYQTAFSGTASVTGNAWIQTRSDSSPLVFTNAAAISEDVAGRSLRLVKTGQGNSAARDFIVGGAISLSNLNLDTGTLQLRGANGVVGTGFGGAPTTITVNGGANAGGTNALPSQGLLHLDNNTGHVVGATTVFAAANNNDRISDTATLNIRGNGIVRLTSSNNVGTTETITNTSIFGHGTLDIVKTGTAVSPVALTLTNLTLGANATANLTGTNLGSTGNNSSRIVIPSVAAVTTLGAQYHSGNEWAKYDNTVDSGFELGAIAFAAGDYTIDATATDAGWAAGQQLKLTSATGTVMSADRTVNRVNSQLGAANQSINLAGFKLTLDEGGFLASTNTVGIRDGAVAAAPSGTAGITAGSTSSPASLFFHANSQVEIMAPITDNAAGGSVTFVKSGTGSVILSHQDRAVAAAQGTTVFTTPTWSSTHTGGWVINDGVLVVHRGQYLGATPTTVTLNGGQLEAHHPVSNANADSILPGWGHNIVINGNATVGADDNGEANDASTGDRALIPMGSLTINNNSTMGVGAFSSIDIAYLGGVTINGRATLNVLRNDGNAATILGGVVSGSGFDVTGYNAAGGTIVLGGNSADAANNTFNSGIKMYAGSLRLNKANGSVALPDTADAEDVVLNGGNLFWGPGQYGDLSTTNNVNTTNNGAASGIMPTSPAAVKNAGMNQIADTATVTLLTGTLGEADRINNEVFGTLIQKNGTLNVGLGTIEVGTATISGGAFGIDRGGKFKAGTLTLLQGAYDPNITTGLSVPGQVTTLEVGAGGLSMSGQNIILGAGGSGNVQGAGSVLKLSGNVTHTGTDLVGGSYGRKGIFVNTGSFRLLNTGNVIDLDAGTRTFTVDGDSIFTVTVPMTNGGITKSGNGALVLEPYLASTFTGAVTVNAGVLQAKGDGAFGTSAGGVTINSGGTVKLDSGWTYGDDFTVSGAGASIAGEVNVLEGGALIAENSTSKITGAFAISGGATLAGATVLDPSVAPGAGGSAYRIGRLHINSAAGITGTGGLTLSGNGDGMILNGVNTTGGGVTKVGGGIWTLAGAGTYTGVTNVNAGVLRITNGSALGTTAGNTVVSGGTLELSGGITSAEPLNLGGAGLGVQGGAVVNASGANTLSGAIALGVAGATVRSDSGTLTLSGNITGSTGLTLSGAGNGTTTGTIATGAGSGATALTKSGTGTWTIANTASLNGATTVNGGTLAISASGTVLDAINPLSFNGGRIVNTGAAQSVFAANLLAGNASITGGAGISLGAINRSSGATANFAGTVTTTSSNTNGILGGYATVGNDWATVSGSNIVALSSYTPFATATATDNATLGVSTTLLAAPTVNSLKVTGGQGIAAVANNIVVNSGGILSSAPYAGITGTGILSGASAGDELIFNTTSGTMDVAIPLIGAGAGSLTKAGNGKLVLRGASAFTGSVNVNGGTLAIVGPGGTTHPTTLGAFASRNINVNGGTFELVGGDFDPGAGGLQFVTGSAGGTLRSTLGAAFTVNDANQLSGNGDLMLTGGGRFTFNASVNYSNFTGGVTVDGGILTVANGANTSTAVFGGRAEQTITLKSGSSIINQQFFGLGGNGLPNNIIAEGGVEFFAVGGNRVYGGDIKLSGTNTIALLERDNHAQERQLYFNGRVSGTGVTLNVHGANNGNPFYLASGANDLTGNINLKPNAMMEVRGPGSLGQNAGDVTVNMEANSRLLLRHWQNADFKANVVTTGNVEINSARLVNYTAGALQFMSLNNVTVNGDAPILTINGGDNYFTRIAGTAALNGTSNNVLQVNSSDLILENGLTFGTPASTFQKRGAFSVLQRGPSNHAGDMILHQSLYVLQDGGTLPSVGSIQLRGGELRVDNSNQVIANRLNDSAPISLGGGALRITGAETLGTVTAVPGTTQIISNPTSETVASALTLTGFTRQTGSVVQFQSPDLGVTTVGAGTFGQSRISSRIVIPGQADTTQTIPGFVGNNGIDFIQYDGTTTDAGAVLGVRDMRNPGSGAAFATNYSDNTAETGWTDSIILRRTNGTDNTVVTDTLTASRSLDAIKVETGGTNRDYTIALGANNLRIEGGGIMVVGNGTADFTVTGTGALTAGPATPGTGTAELFIGGNGTNVNGTININSVIGNNGTQSVALVKTGSSQLNLNGTAANTYTGGTYITGGTVNTTVTGAFGAASNPIYLSGGTLQFNIANAANALDLGVPDHTINVLANSTIILDNGALAGTDNDITVGALNINGPYTLSMRGFDSTDISFTGTHTFAGTPVLDLQQLNTNSVSTGNATTITLNGAIQGSGFQVATTGSVTGTAPNNSDNSAATLQIGGGAADTSPNTYSGKLTLLLGNSSVIAGFNEDMIVQLNKAAGTTAITGDIEINGGLLRNMAANQIADTSNMVLNWGQYDGNASNETIASVTMKGGSFRTNQAAVTANTITVTGDFNATGMDDAGGGNVDGIQVNSNSTLSIGGSLKLNGYSRAVLGASGATLNIVGALEITGNTVSQNSGAGANIVRLSGGVVTNASSNVARLGNSTDSDTFLELNGTQTFNTADGAAGLDLSVSSVIRNSTVPVATGAIVKTGAGVMQIEGGTTANSYTGTTTVNEGSVVLFKSAGVNAIPAGALTIGDGTGGAKADKVILRSSNQIADTNNVTISSSGVLDLATFAASETVASITGDGAVDLGSGSVLTVGGSTTETFSGSISGSGTLTRSGSGTTILSGSLNDVLASTVSGTSKLIVNGVLGGDVLVQTGATFGGSGTASGTIVVQSGGLLSPGNSPGILSTGSLNLQDGGTLGIEITGSTAGSGYDQVNVAGTVSLLQTTGALVTLSGSYVPGVSDQFAIIINDGVDAVNGTFAGYGEGASVGFFNGVELFITYAGNADGGAVGNDVLLTVPEPGSATLLIGGLAMLLGRRRRKQA